eukprot:scaffold114854_cov51-Prasinocladus_malaysianus.AAC.1
MTSREGWPLRCLAVRPLTCRRKSPKRPGQQRRQLKTHYDPRWIFDTRGHAARRQTHNQVHPRRGFASIGPTGASARRSTGNRGTSIFPRSPRKDCSVLVLVLVVSVS